MLSHIFQVSKRDIRVVAPIASTSKLSKELLVEHNQRKKHQEQPLCRRAASAIRGPLLRLETMALL